MATGDPFDAASFTGPRTDVYMVQVRHLADDADDAVTWTGQAYNAADALVLAFIDRRLAAEDELPGPFPGRPTKGRRDGARK